jgi:hypothetical protein
MELTCLRAFNWISFCSKLSNVNSVVIKAHMPACCLGSLLPLGSLIEHLTCISSSMKSEVWWKLGWVNVLLFPTQADICVLWLGLPCFQLCDNDIVLLQMVQRDLCLMWKLNEETSGIVICSKFHHCHWWGIHLLDLQVIGCSLDKSRQSSDYEQQKKRFQMLQLFSSIFAISSLVLES